MDAVNELLDRVRVVLTAAVTWITLAATVVQFVILQFDSVPVVAQYGGAVLAFLVGLVAVIRRVTPVEPEERGILPS